MRDQEEAAESYITYKTMASQTASELQELQGKLQDANTVLEKHNQGNEVKDIELEIEDYDEQAEKDQEVLSALFNERQSRENRLRDMEIEIEKHMNQTQQMFQNMNETERETFLRQQQVYNKLSEGIQEIEGTIDQTRNEIARLENDLSHDPRRKELIPLYTEFAHL